MHLSCSLCSSWTRFLTCPLWYFDRCFSRWCRKLWLSRSCSPSTVVVIPFVPQRQNLMVQTIQRIIEIPQLPLVFRWSLSLLCSGAAVEKITFLLVGRPRCSASWPVWLHRTVMPRHSCAWLVLLVTSSRCVGQTSTEAFGRIYSIFYVYVDLDPEVDSRRENLDKFCQLQWLLEEFQVFFYVKVDMYSEVDFRACPGAGRTRKCGHFFL